MPVVDGEARTDCVRRRKEEAFSRANRGQTELSRLLRLNIHWHRGETRVAAVGGAKKARRKGKKETFSRASRLVTRRGQVECTRSVFQLASPPNIAEGDRSVSKARYWTPSPLKLLFKTAEALANFSYPFKNMSDWETLSLEALAAARDAFYAHCRRFTDAIRRYVQRETTSYFSTLKLPRGAFCFVPFRYIYLREHLPNANARLALSSGEHTKPAQMS